MSAFIRYIPVSLSSGGSSGGGVTQIGAIDSQTPSSNALTISGVTLYAQSASATDPGMVNNLTQTFSGDKTFTGSVATPSLLLNPPGITSASVTNATAGGSIVVQTQTADSAETPQFIVSGQDDAWVSQTYTTYLQAKQPSNGTTNLVIAGGSDSSSAGTNPLDRFLLSANRTQFTDGKYQTVPDPDHLFSFINNTGANNVFSIVAPSGQTGSLTDWIVNSNIVASVSATGAVSAPTVTAIDFISASANPASFGVLSLANNEGIGWRNSTNNGNNSLIFNSSNVFAFDAPVTSTGNITATNSQLISTIATGTAPLVVSSTTRVANLNATTSGTSINAPILAGDGTNIIAATTTGSGSTAVLSSAPTLSNPVVGTQSQGDSSTKAASTAYVDVAVANAVAGVNPAVAVQAATTAASDTSGFTYTHAAGVGDFFTGSVNTAVTIDGFTFTALGQRLLVKNDTQSPSGAFNGVYYVTQLQTGILAPVLTRALDYDMPSDMNNTGAIPVINGTVNGTTQWVLTSLVVTVGTTPLTFTKFSSNPATVGTVTSVTFTGDGTVLSSTPSTAVTTSGTVTAALKTQTARTFLQGPLSGAAANPTFGALTAPTVQVFTATGTRSGFYIADPGAVVTANLVAGAVYTNAGSGNSFTALNSVSNGSTGPIFWSGSGTYSGGTMNKVSGTGPATLSYTTSFASDLATYTAPTSPPPLYIRVRMAGGGGGGSSSGNGAGGNGSNSTFGTALLVAKFGTGGSTSGGDGGVGGTASLGTGPIGTAITGGYGQGSSQTSSANANYFGGGMGGTNPFGGGGGGGSLTSVGKAGSTNTGAGGGGGGTASSNNAVSGTGGGAGGFVDALISAPSATYFYGIGAGGTAGSGTGTAGGAGAAGYIEVTEYYQ